MSFPFEADFDEVRDNLDAHVDAVFGCLESEFLVRREDMKKLILATRGKIFTLLNMQQLVEHTRLKEFRSREV